MTVSSVSLRCRIHSAGANWTATSDLAEYQYFDWSIPFTARSNIIHICVCPASYAKCATFIPGDVIMLAQPIIGCGQLCIGDFLEPLGVKDDQIKFSG